MNSALRSFTLSLLALLAASPPSPAPAQPSIADQASGKLKIDFVDVEGGQSTLFVAPNGRSLLIDAGWPGNEGRDADRIVAVARNAGIAKIDYLLLTHYHTDHVRGVPLLVAASRRYLHRPRPQP